MTEAAPMPGGGTTRPGFPCSSGPGGRTEFRRHCTEFEEEPGRPSGRPLLCLKFGPNCVGGGFGAAFPGTPTMAFAWAVATGHVVVGGAIPPLDGTGNLPPRPGADAPARASRCAAAGPNRVGGGSAPVRDALVSAVLACIPAGLNLVGGGGMPRLMARALLHPIVESRPAPTDRRNGPAPGARPRRGTAEPSRSRATVAQAGSGEVRRLHRVDPP